MCALRDALLPGSGNIVISGSIRERRPAILPAASVLLPRKPTMSSNTAASFRRRGEPRRVRARARRGR